MACGCLSHGLLSFRSLFLWFALRWPDAGAACSCCFCRLQWSPLLTSRFSSWCRGRRGQASCDAGEVRGRSAAGSPAAAAARVRATRSSRSHVAGASLMRHARVTELGDVWVPSVSPSCLESVDGFFEAHGPWDRQHSGWMVGWVQFWSNLRHDTHTGWRANKQSKGPRATRRITEMAAAAPPRTGYDAPTSSCRRRQAAAPALHLLPRRRVPTAVVPFHLRSPPPAGHGATSDPPPTCDIQEGLLLHRKTTLSKKVIYEVKKGTVMFFLSSRPTAMFCTCHVKVVLYVVCVTESKNCTYSEPGQSV
ncbi:hypothetical protein SEVIR_8G043050v4 [Setaria viridis]